MITIPRPSMALHADDVEQSAIRLWNNGHVPVNDPVDHMVGWVASVARSAPGGRLAMLLINCHGLYNPQSNGQWTGGYGIPIGEGIRLHNVGKFSGLNGLVDNIWINGCGVARISEPTAAGNGDGNKLCGALADASGAYVVAGTSQQVVPIWLPDDTIDDFEGLVLRYKPGGGVDWAYDYGYSFRAMFNKYQ